MAYYYFDTSALAKRYSPETGSQTVDNIVTGKINIVMVSMVRCGLKFLWETF